MSGDGSGAGFDVGGGMDSNNDFGFPMSLCGDNRIFMSSITNLSFHLFIRMKTKSRNFCSKVLPVFRK